MLCESPRTKEQSAAGEWKACKLLYSPVLMLFVLHMEI